MNEKRTSVFSNGLIWFGAGVSLAEILTGTYFAPLGFGKAMAAILLGHLIGGLMMFAAGMIGAKERKSAMETVKMSFGERGSLLFAILNVLQLVGWTAIMIYDGALHLLYLYLQLYQMPLYLYLHHCCQNHIPSHLQRPLLLLSVKPSFLQVCFS